MREWVNAVLTPVNLSHRSSPGAVNYAAPSPRYRTHAGSSSLTVDSNRQCWPFGGIGDIRKVHPSSASSLSALRWLQVEQHATQFSQVCWPPRLRGTTWSTVSALPPQYAQR